MILGTATRSASRSWRSSTNAIMLLVSGALEAGLGDLLFWGSLSFALAVAGVVAWPVNPAG